MALRVGSGTDRFDEDEASSEVMAEINITPLTDVFLVLLVIFMVTTTAMNQTGVSVDLPQASKETSESQADGLIVTLLPSGRVRVLEQEFGPQEGEKLQAQMQVALEKATSKVVILEGDRQALLGSAIEVMDLAKKAGAKSFAIATDSSEIPKKR